VLVPPAYGIGRLGADRTRHPIAEIVRTPVRFAVKRP
jgi:hypothetical protein